MKKVSVVHGFWKTYAVWNIPIKENYVLKSTRYQIKKDSYILDFSTKNLVFQLIMK